MPKRGKSERRDPEEGPKSPVTNKKGRIRTPEVAKLRGALMIKTNTTQIIPFPLKKM